MHVVHGAVALLDPVEEVVHVHRAAVDVTASVADGRAGALLLRVAVLVLGGNVLHGARVRGDVAREVPRLTQHLDQQRVGARWDAVDGVV